MRRRLCVLLPPVLALVGLMPVAAAPTPAEITKSLFVTVLDQQSGQPVKDMTADEIAIREDGSDRKIVEMKPALQPVFVEMLVDTSGVQGAEDVVRDMRVAVTGFCKALVGMSPNSQISLMEFGQASVTVVEYTSDPIELEKGVNKLFPHPNAPSVLTEAVIEANKRLAKKPGNRKAIVVLNIEPNNESTHPNGEQVMDAFRKSNAGLWAVSFQRSSRDIVKNANQDIVLQQMPKLTGGNREFIAGVSAMETLLKTYATNLIYQYEVVFQRPEGKKPPKAIQIGSNRPGVKLHASGFAPQ
jgi:von Willebrand factor type A domain